MVKSAVSLSVTLIVTVMLAVCCITSIPGADAEPAGVEIHMNADDVFIFSPSLPNENAVISAYGEGVIGSAAASVGAFLNWDPTSGTLSGVAYRSGAYTVTIMAEWIENGEKYEMIQVLEMIVGESIGQTSNVIHFEDSWITVVEPISSEEGITVEKGITFVDILCLIMTGGLVTSFLIFKDPVSAILAVASSVISVVNFLGIL